MIRGTTPVLRLKIKGAMLNGSSVYITISQGAYGILMTKTGSDLTITEEDGTSTVEITLSQADTLSLKKGSALIQARWINSEGIACATPIKEFTITDILLNGEIEYAG